MRSKFDISAYLVIGPENTSGRSVVGIVKDAVEAGFTCIQLRSKTASAMEMIDLAEKIAKGIESIGKSEEVTLLINDRLDVALAARMKGVKVDGVHVGQSDIPVCVCRKYLGEDAVIGLSAPTEEILTYMESADIREIDYFGAGPLHATPTKVDCGLDSTGTFRSKSYEEIAELSRISNRPVVFGGGVKAEHLADLAKTGVDGFFVVSAITEASDPRRAAEEMVRIWKKAKR